LSNLGKNIRHGNQDDRDDALCLLEKLVNVHHIRGDSLWGTPWIDGKLLKLGGEASAAAVESYLPWRPSETR
jgi:hypothetical protein